MSKMDDRNLRLPVPKHGGLVRVEQVEAASELDGFVYIVSHDLRNSARALTEVPHWLREDLNAQGVKFSRDVQENFELLDRHAKRLDRMLLDLLIYSRVGRMQTVTEFDYGALVDSVCEEVNLPDRVTVQCEVDMPNLRIGYKDAFVLTKNVIDNVVTHCTAESPVLTIQARRRNDEVTLTFTDNGNGIPMEDMQRAFRPMATLARRDDVEGSGMGLAIIHRIAKHYRGELWAGPGPDGVGFRMRIRLRDANPLDGGPTFEPSNSDPF
jgi:light-regulated signal transduction histidine kinase (bacteriophytochrome)